MKSINQQSEVAVEFIQIGDRIRKQTGDLEILKKSIARIGLVHPIVVDENYRLLSGYRRLESVKQLGWKKVPIKILMISADSARKEWEIEENLCRKDFSVQELKIAEEILNFIRNKSIFSKLYLAICKMLGFLSEKIFRR